MKIQNIQSGHTRTECPIQSNYTMHTHNGYELLYLIHGDADYAVEGNVYRLKRGDIMLMRRSESHYLILRSTACYERLVVNFELTDTEVCDSEAYVALSSMLFHQPLGKYNHFASSLFPDNHWQYYMNRICSYSDPDRKMIYLLPLLNELSEGYEKVKSSPEQTISNKSSAIVSYINRHLFDELSLERICEYFFLSKSQLNRVFRKTTGTTVWNYILIKRLFHAREMMQGGENPTSIYEKCGFQDYVTFYKAYQKHFGCMPKADYRKKSL